MRDAVEAINSKRRDAGHSDAGEEMGLLDPYNRLGGPPLWLHSAPVLKTPTGNTNLTFLGQINTFAIGDLADFMAYAFYCPTEELLLTTMQRT